GRRPEAHADAGAVFVHRGNLDLPAHAVRALAHDGQTVVVMRIGRWRADTVAVVLDDQADLAVRLTLQGHPRRARPRVTHHVRQRLAHDLQHMHLLVGAEQAGAEIDI